MKTAFVMSSLFALLTLPSPTIRAEIIRFPLTTGDLTYTFASRATSSTRVTTDTRSVTLLLPRFDPSLGNLQSASLTYTSTAKSTLIGALRSARSFPTGINANLQVDFSLSPSGSGTNIPLTIPFSDLNQTITVASGVRNFGIDLLTSQTRASSTVFMPLSYLSTMTGSGTVNAPFSMLFREEITTSGGTIDYIFSASTKSDFILEYGYTAVPEPSSTALLFIGAVVGLVWQKKRTSRSSA